MGKPLVRFCEGQEFNCDMDKILWHRRESRRQQRKQILPCSHGSLLSTRKWPFSAISASSDGITCAAYTSTPPRNSADFLELAENGTFLDRKLIRVFNETAEGHPYQFPSTRLKLLDLEGSFWSEGV
jgi:hypothetical protein